VTGGAFDITLGPLIDAWGFGSGQRMNLDSTAVDSLLQFVGMEKVQLTGEYIYKSNPNVKLNVNAIAQGYAVDVVSSFLEELGCENYMVEIGGEIRTKGVNETGNFWRIGIDRPKFGNNIPGENLKAVISLHNRSIATSGNYRKYFEQDGIRITHTIDPISGFPKETNLLSVSILMKDCMTADAYATACMVMGLERAKEFVKGQNRVEAYFIYGDEYGNYQEWYTDGLTKYIETL
jgi:thiamine biosynthesis lipoprotein